MARTVVLNSSTLSGSGGGVYFQVRYISIQFVCLYLCSASSSANAAYLQLSSGSKEVRRLNETSFVCCPWSAGSNYILYYECGRDENDDMNASTCASKQGHVFFTHQYQEHLSNRCTYAGCLGDNMLFFCTHTSENVILTYWNLYNNSKYTSSSSSSLFYYDQKVFCIKCAIIKNRFNVIHNIMSNIDSHTSFFYDNDFSKGSPATTYAFEYKATAQCLNMGGSGTNKFTAVRRVNPKNRIISSIISTSLILFILHYFWKSNG